MTIHRFSIEERTLDLHELIELTTMEWIGPAEDQDHGQLTLVATCGGVHFDKVIIRCLGVRMAVLPSPSPRIYLSEIEAEDLRGSQLEGIRARLHDFGTRQMDISCNLIEISAGTKSGREPVLVKFPG